MPFTCRKMPKSRQHWPLSHATYRHRRRISAVTPDVPSVVINGLEKTSQRVLTLREKAILNTPILIKYFFSEPLQPKNSFDLSTGGHIKLTGGLIRLLQARMSLSKTLDRSVNSRPQVQLTWAQCLLKWKTVFVL